MALQNTKRLVRRLCGRLGIDVRAFRPETSDAARIGAVLRSHAVDLVIDVGANFGGYAEFLRYAGYDGRIVCFEPLAAAHAHLAHMSARDALLTVAPRMALGARDGEIEINVSKNYMSSSALPIGRTHVALVPDSAYMATERVRLARLDSIAGEVLGDAKRVFLKADTQGFEAQVVEGARGVLHRLIALQLELALVPLYEGETGFFDMVEHMRGLGFELYTLVPGFSDTRTGRMLALDAVFLRPEPLTSDSDMGTAT